MMPTQNENHAVTTATVLPSFCWIFQIALLQIWLSGSLTFVKKSSFIADIQAPIQDEAPVGPHPDKKVDGNKTEPPQSFAGIRKSP